MANNKIWEGDDTSPQGFQYSNIIVPPYAVEGEPDRPHLNSGTRAKDIQNNMKALMSYIQLIMTSDSDANPMKPEALGDKYFLKTTQTCKLDNGKTVDRYMYIQNAPDGRYNVINLPVANLNGLLPGMVTNLVKSNPASLFMALANSGTDECVEVTAKVTPYVNGEIDFKSFKRCALEQSSTNKSGEANPCWKTRPMTKSDAYNMDPCQLENGINNYEYNGKRPTGGNRSCKNQGGLFQKITEGFESLESSTNDNTNCEELLIIFGLAILICIIIYIFYKKK